MPKTERRLETPSPVPPRLKNAGGGAPSPPRGRGRPSPLGRGWTAMALSPAVAGRVRGQLRGEDGSDSLDPSCSMETSNASSFWRAKRGISLWTFRSRNSRARCSVRAQRHGSDHDTIKTAEQDTRSTGELNNNQEQQRATLVVGLDRTLVMGLDSGLNRVLKF